MSVIESNRIISGPGSAGDFTKSLLPLYLGPTVKLHIGSSAKGYKVHVDLLSKKSPYFAKMFQDGRFTEGITRRADLEPMEGVVSTRSLEMLIEWIYQARVTLSSGTDLEKISELLEFLRIADMCDVHGMEQASANYVLDILRKTDVRERRDVIHSKHITSASLLPTAHPLRPVIAKAAATIYLLDENDTFPHFDGVPGPASLFADITLELVTMIHGADMEATGPWGGRGQKRYIVNMKYQDPLSDEDEGEKIETSRSVPRQ